MSIYNTTKVKKCFEIEQRRDHKLKSFCKIFGISEVGLIKLIIDELRVDQYDDSLRSTLQRSIVRVKHFVGVYDGDRPQMQGFNENGEKQYFLFKEVERDPFHRP